MTNDCCDCGADHYQLYPITTPIEIRCAVCGAQICCGESHVQKWIQKYLSG